MKTLNELTDTSPELGMKHYDKGKYGARVTEIQNLAAKEASYCQAVGYVPTRSISNQDWEDMLIRNERSKQYGGEYVMAPTILRNESRHP